ncbi:jg14150, partial [Pararge aegeria aegeria]
PPPGPAAPLDPWGLPSPPAHAPAARKQPFHLEFAPMVSTKRLFRCLLGNKCMRMFYAAKPIFKIITCEAKDTSPDAWSSVASPAKDPWAPAALAAPAATTTRSQKRRGAS